VPPGHFFQGPGGVAGPARRTAVAGDGEERDEGEAAVAAGSQDVGVTRVVEAEAVLDADDRRDGLGLVQVLDGDVGDAQVADQARLLDLAVLMSSLAERSVEK
jgi:hypothetical protein